MKQIHPQANLPDTSLKLTPVRFEYAHPTAKTVYLAGSLNLWQPAARALHSTGAGNWWAETALAPGTYEYCFVVDGQWVPDPRSQETVANPFGGRNSVLHVAFATAAAQRADTEPAPFNKESSRRIPLM